MKLSKQYLDALGYKVLGACIEVHKALGPGLLERVYQVCLAQELSLREISFETEMSAQAQYKGFELEAGLRCDFFIEQCMVLEIKSVETMNPLFEAQLLSYMNALKAPKGMLVNFNCYNLFKNGQKTYVNRFFESLPDI